MEAVQYEIPNWSKFNPRSDRANFSWFRFQNGFFHDEKVFDLSDFDRLLFIFLLCETSRKNKQPISFSIQYVATILKRRTTAVRNSLKKLNSAGLIRLTEAGIEPPKSRRKDGQEPTKLPATYERTDVRDGTLRNETEKKEVFANEAERELPTEILELNRKLLERREREEISNLLDGELGKLAGVGN